jgi:hypothetical protein
MRARGRRCPVAVSGPATNVCVADTYTNRVVEVPGDPAVVLC